jgi:hypothetical protein
MADPERQTIHDLMETAARGFVADMQFEGTSRPALLAQFGRSVGRHRKAGENVEATGDRRLLVRSRDKFQDFARQL